MKTPALFITKHACKRFKQRTGLPKRIMKRQATNAKNDGVPLESLSGQIKTYLKEISEKTLAKTEPRLYQGFIWIFIGNQLITLYPLPGQYSKYLMN
jgi:hypothetical protein